MTPEATIVVASLTADSGEEARRWAAFVIKTGAVIAGADSPRSAVLAPARNLLENGGFEWHEEETSAAQWGDCTARRRCIVFATKVALAEQAQSKEAGKARSIIVPANMLDQSVWLRGGTLTLDTRIPAQGEKEDPSHADATHEAGSESRSTVARMFSQPEVQGLHRDTWRKDSCLGPKKEKAHVSGRSNRMRFGEPMAAVRRNGSA